MKIKTIGLAAKPGNKQDFSFAWTPTDSDMSAVEGDVKVRGTVQYTGAVYRVEGVISYTRTFACDRCLKLCVSEEKVEFSEDFAPVATDDDCVTVFDGSEIDLSDAVRDNVIAAVPLANLCRSDCLGLCPVCGQDLNIGGCSCEKSSVDPRLEALLAWKPNG